jgi:polysaccharide deacetylase family protein (PEP-CTERM system associated)
MLNALTIDVEDWYHPELVRSRVSLAGDTEPQIEDSTRALLNLLRQRGAKATFFVVGEVAQRHPQLVQEIVAEGHELGCHGMSHRPLWQMTPDEFQSELRQFAATMSSTVPEAEIVGFRAPTFSLDNRTRWALTVLGNLGYHYDSSIFPFRTPVYGVGGGPLEPYRPSLSDVAVADGQGPLLEFPMSVWSWAGLRVPICGGFYLRSLPFQFILSCLRQINHRRQPFVIYVHPWETFADTPRLALPPVSRLITYYNLKDMMARLTRLLDAFCFAPMRTVLETLGCLQRPYPLMGEEPGAGERRGEVSK